MLIKIKIIRKFIKISIMAKITLNYKTRIEIINEK
jgi:hypothetical protein